MPSAQKSAAELVELATDLRVAAGRLLRRTRAAAAGGLTPSQLAVLTTLEEHGQLRLGELAHREGVAPPTMSRTVDALLLLGLVARRPDPADARSTFVELTAAGRAVIRRTADRRTTLLAEHLRRLSSSELRTIRDVLPVLHRLADDLGNDE